MSLSDIDRHPNWAKRLMAIASIHVTQSAEWGKTDCIMTVGEAMRAVVGVHPFEHFAGTYTTELGAAKVMRQHDCEDVDEVFSRFLGLSELNRLQVRRGDVAVVMIQDKPHAGYILNDGITVRQEGGMITMPLDTIEKAFQIGRR